MVKINKLLITLALIFAITFAGCSSQNNEDLNKTNSEDSKNNSTENIVQIQKEEVQIQKEDATKSETQIQEEKLTQLIADGVHTEDVSYISPGGNENFKLTLEIKENVVENVEIIQSTPISEVGKKKVASANAQLQTLLVGKSLDEVEIPTIIVSGASLTSKAFNEKLNELKAN